MDSIAQCKGMEKHTIFVQYACQPIRTCHTSRINECNENKDRWNLFFLLFLSRPDREGKWHIHMCKNHNGTHRKCKLVKKFNKTGRKKSSGNIFNSAQVVCMHKHSLAFSGNMRKKKSIVSIYRRSSQIPYVWGRQWNYHWKNKKKLLIQDATKWK